MSGAYAGKGARARAMRRTRCQCAEWSGGVRCPWTGPERETRLVAVVPLPARATARLTGALRRLLTKHLRVSAECADHMLDVDREWIRVIE